MCTIFFDEIADFPWESQRKILGAIRERVIKRVGEEKERNINVRFIAATNRNITKEKEEGIFGNDLYYSFGEHLFIPPLRERKNDIPFLAHYFLDKYVSKYDFRERGITHQAMEYMLSYTWPGNTRELKNCIIQGLSKSKDVICVQHLPDEIRGSKAMDMRRSAGKRKPKSLDDMEKAHIIELLQFTRGNKEKAVKILNISKPTLYKKIRKYDLPMDLGKRF